VRAIRLVGAARVIHCVATDDANSMKNPELNIKISDAEGKRRLIADIAYSSAEQRGFAPGYELDDWLQAEQEVEASMEAVEPSALNIRS
jgi:hypothetical protein